MRGAATGLAEKAGSSSAPDEREIPASTSRAAGNANRHGEYIFMLERSSKHLIPGRPVLEHHFTQQPDGRHPVAQHLVVEFLQ